jgi:hypothetical protein
MKKTNRIRYFVVITIVCACLSYYLGYQIIGEIRSTKGNGNESTKIAATEKATDDNRVNSEVEIANMKPAYEYVIVNEGGSLTVYMKDLKTVYMYTDISYGKLSKDLQQEITQGKKFTTLQELYAFLENYSS